MPLGPPPLRAGVVDRNGVMARPWQQWFDALWRQAGGSLDSTTPAGLFATATAQTGAVAADVATSGLAITALEGQAGSAIARLTALEGEAGVLADQVTALETQAAAFLAQIAALETVIDGLEAVIAALPPPTVVLVDGVAAPAVVAGHATVYVDTADGSLKVIFASGIVKVLTTDP